MRTHEILISFDGQSVEILPVSIFTSEILAIPSPRSQGSSVSRLEDFHASAPSLLFQIYSPATLCAQNNRMRSESHKVKVSSPYSCFPPKSF